MPARSFRVTVHNESADLTLVHAGDHLCGGAWTDGWNPPPDKIGPGESAGWQSESDGIFTGTEGWAIYDVDRADGRQGQFEVWWDNPYYGHTDFRFPFSSGDVPPLCDYDNPSGGSAFAPDLSTLSFAVEGVSFGYTEAGGEVNAPVDFAAAALVGPTSLLGLLGILKDPRLEIRVREKDPSFQDMGAQSLREFTTATAKDWLGDWRADQVTVSISQAGFNTVSATIDDKTADPALEFTAEFAVGPGWMTSRLTTTPLVTVLRGNAGDGNGDINKLLTQAAQATLTAGASPESGKPWTALRFANDVSAAAASAGVAAPDTTTTLSVGRELAGLVASSRSHVRLDHGVGLTLYQVVQDGSVIGEQIGYQRMTLAEPTTDVQLLPHYNIT